MYVCRKACFHSHLQGLPNIPTLAAALARVYCFAGLVVTASVSRAADLGFNSRFHRGSFPGRVVPVTSTVVLQWLPCQAPGVIGSVLGPVSLVSVYCDWVGQKV